MTAGIAKPGIDLDALGDRPHIVVTVRDHMSGVLYSVPALRALRQRWPDAKITLMTSAYSAPVLDGGCPYLDQILPVYSFADEPKPTDRLIDLFRKFRTWMRLVGRVDLVVHLRDVGGGTLLFCKLLGNPKQIGYTQGRFNEYLTVDIGSQNVELGSRERNQIVLDGLGVEPAGKHLELWISETDARWAAGWLAERGHPDGAHLTVIHPGCHWGCNQWIPERWSETANEMLDRHGGSVVITGVHREIPLAERIAAGIDGRVLNAAGETSLSQFAALIDQADMVLSVDASPTQICQARDKPAVILMGAGNPAWNGPVGDEPMRMLQEWDNDNPRPEICDWAAGACNGPQCTTRLEDISVTQVIESVDDLRRR